MFAPLENTCAYPTGSITKGTVSFFKHVPPIGRFGMSSVRTALAWRSQRVKGRKRENCWRTGQSDAVQRRTKLKASDKNAFREAPLQTVSPSF